MSKPRVLIALATDILGGPGKGLEQFLRHGGLEHCYPIVLDYHIQDADNDTEYAKVMQSTGVTLEPLLQKNALDFSLIEQGLSLIKKHNIEILQSHGYKSHLLCYLLHRKTGLPWIAVVEGWTSENFKIHCYTALEHILIHGATEIVAVSKSLRSRLWPLARKRCQVIANAIASEELQVTIQRQDMRRQLGIAEDALVFGAMGRLSPEKNLQLFLRALVEVKKVHPQAHALIMGEGQEKDALQKLAKNLGLEKNCTFTGHITGTANYYNTLDIQVMPSLSEGMPYAALEGMCMQLPLVASDAGGIPEVVLNGQTGLLFPSNNLAGFTKALLRVSGDASLRQRLGQAGKERIASHFSPEVRTQNFIRLYHENIQSSHAMVTKPTPPYDKAASVPAKAIGSPLEEGQKKLESITSTHKPVVLQFLTTLNMGGAERLAISILENNKEHVQGMVGAIQGESGDLATLAHSLQIPAFSLHAESCGRIQTIIRLYKMLREHKVDLIHTHAAYLLNYAVPAAKLAGIPVIFTEHSIFDLQQIPALRRAITWSAPFLNSITCISQPIAQYFAQHLNIGTPPMRIIENGIDTKQFSPKGSKQNEMPLPLPWQESPITKDTPLFIFGTVARLCPEKDHPTLLQAFAKVAAKQENVRLLMVGDGAERERTEALIRELALTDKVHITGKCLNIVEHLHAMDIFVMSSEHEGLPMAILEAMACAVPVISTDAGDIASLNSTGEHVYLVPKKDVNALALAMENMYNNQKLRQNFADRALNFVVQEKSAHTMADAYYSVFKNAGLSF